MLDNELMNKLEGQSQHSETLAGINWNYKAVSLHAVKFHVFVIHNCLVSHTVTPGATFMQPNELISMVF
jgi:hypothetical protein